MASVGNENQEVMPSFIETDIDISMNNASASDMQVKEEPDYTRYEQTSVTPCLTSNNFTQDSRNSSSDHLSSCTHFSASSVNQLDTIENPTSQMPVNNTFAGSTIRSQLHGAVASKKIDTVQNIVENLLKKNETLLAMSDAGGLKPNARRVRAAHDGFVKRTNPAFPSAEHASVFPVSHSLLSHGSASKETLDTLKHMIHSKSPTCKKNETVLAMSDAGGLKPNTRRVRAAHDSFVKRAKPAFPSAEQASVFPVSHSLLAHVNANKGTSDTLKHHLMRPKSPTRRYNGILKDKTHFTYALMESSAADHEIEKIFNVQNHELVCAIGSRTLITDKVNKIVASLEFCYFWCNFCPFTTNSKSLLTQHVLEHRFCCKYCAYESFCRSDIMRHMHKMHNDFKDTASNLSYLTFLSDFLRVKSTKKEKENKDPDEDVNNIEQEKIDTALLDLEGSKRKSVLEKDECVSVVNKIRRIDGSHGTENTVLTSSIDISLDRQETSGQSHSSYHPPPSAEADYDIFDMEVEDIIDSQFHLTADESNTKKSVSFSNHTLTATSDKQSSRTGMVHIGPHIQDRRLQIFTATHDHSSSGICNVHHPNGLYNKSYHGNDASNLYWSCDYCTFQSSSQTEIKDHSSKLHPGKPHRYVALIKNIASNSFMSKNMKGNVPGYSTAANRNMNTNQSHFDHLRPNVADLFHINSDSKSDDSTSSKYDTMSLSENGASHSLLNVNMNSSTLAKKELAVVKCFHCLYTSRRHWTMKNHIYHKHRGMGLVAVAHESPCTRLFFCARDDCTFRSDDASLYLIHVDQCIPWNKPESADVEVEPHIRECLDQTITLAEVSKVKEIEHTKSKLSKDSCNTMPEDVTESIHNIQLLLKGQSSDENHPVWIQSSESDVSQNVETPIAKMVKNTVDVCEVIGSDTPENAYNHLCPQILTIPVEFDHCSNNTFLKVLSSEDIFDNPSSLENQMSDKPYVCNSGASNQIDTNKHTSNFCTSAAFRDKFTSDKVVDVKTKVTCSSDHSSELGGILIEHSKTELVKSFPDLTVTENRAYSVSVNEVGLSQNVLTTKDSDSVLKIENNGPESEIMQRKNHNDHSVSQFMKCKDSSSAVDLVKKYTANDVKNDKYQLKIARLGKTETFLPISNFNAESDKHDSPSLKIQFCMVGRADVYNLSNNTQQPEPAEANRKIRASDTITCDSSTCSGSCIEENNNSTQNDCTEALQMQNPWIKDLIDSGEDSVSDQTFYSSDIHCSLNSVPNRYTSSLSDKRNSFFSYNTIKANQTSTNLQEQASVCNEGNGKCIIPGQFLKEKPEAAGVIIKPHYSFVPLRSAAVKAISKMKPVLACEIVNKDFDSSNNCKGKKSALKRKLSCPRPYLNTNHTFSANRKCKLSSHKIGSKMSKSVYMCQYCIGISEGPLEKIKSHVLSKHSSMPPMVINCFKQRHHISCQFYICPYDSCYKLSRTQEESETHKSTHEKEKLQKSSPELFESNIPFSANIDQIKKASNTKPVRACRVELNILDMSKINSAGSVLVMPEKKKYQCLYCTSYYYDETLQGMKAHYIREHEGQLIVIRDTEARRLQLPSRIYVCDNPNCQHSYINRSDLDNHANSHKSNLTFIYECASCGWYSASRTAGCRHVRNEHADEEAVSLVQMQVSVDEYGQTSKIIL